MYWAIVFTFMAPALLVYDWRAAVVAAAIAVAMWLASFLLFPAHDLRKKRKPFVPPDA